MSHTSIPQKARWQIWLAAGGRCEYRGCNEALWRDELTLRQMNRAYLAHIIADSPKGPRGDPLLSDKLKADPSNIMLLCDAHHRLIDIEDVKGHPIELLRQFKQEHEERIERVTGIQRNRRTHILLFGTRIGERGALVSHEQALEALLPERYPTDNKGILIDLARIDMCEEDPEFWVVMKRIVDRGLGHYLSDGVGPSGKPINHLSIFALAPIPALIYLGKRLGDIVSADVYQRHRSANDWRWKDLNDPGFDYIVEHPIGDNVYGRSVAINLSLSGKITKKSIDNTMKGNAPIYTMTIAKPNRDYLHAKEQLELFRNEWYALLSRIRENHGDGSEIHLFPAIPNSIAVEIGRSLLPKSDPMILIYDYHRKKGFERTIRV